MMETFEADSPNLQRFIKQKNYKAFLHSQRWKDLRIACFAHYFPSGKAPYCFVCGRPGRIFLDSPTITPAVPLTHSKNVGTHLCVHHLSYPAVDPATDLVPLCGRCNFQVEKFDPSSGVRERGLSAKVFRQRMLREFAARSRLKVILRQLVQDQKDAVLLAELAMKEKARLKSGKLSPNPTPSITEVEGKVSGYLRWLKRKRLTNHVDSAAQFLVEVDINDGTIDFSPSPRVGKS